MATKSVATKKRNARLTESDHDLWLHSGQCCVTIRLDRECSMAPPDSGQLTCVNDTIAGLAKAVEIIANLLEGGEITDTWSTGLALNGLADAIVLHTSLAEGINNNLHPDEAPSAQEA